MVDIMRMNSQELQDLLGRLKIENFDLKAALDQNWENLRIVSQRLAEVQAAENKLAEEKVRKKPVVEEAPLPTDEAPALPAKTQRTRK